MSSFAMADLLAKSKGMDSGRRQDKHCKRPSKERLIQLMEENKYCTAKVAEILNVSHMSVRNYCYYYGIELGRKNHTLVVNRNTVAKEYEAGATVSGLMRKYKCSRSTIYRWLEEKEVKLRNGSLVHLDEDRVFELRAQGLSQDEIATRLGCSQSKISYVLNGRKKNED